MSNFEDNPIWRDTALIVALFTMIGCFLQFVVNPLLNNYLEKAKENRRNVKDED